MQTKDIYYYQDGPYTRSLDVEGYLEYIRIMDEGESDIVVEFFIKRIGWFDTHDNDIEMEDTVFLSGREYYDAIFIGGITDHALDIACESAKQFLKID